jgi:hypothetical protein
MTVKFIILVAVFAAIAVSAHLPARVQLAKGDER